MSHPCHGWRGGGAGLLTLALLATTSATSGCRSKRELLARGEGAAVVVVPGTNTADPAEPITPSASEREPNNKPNQAQLLRLGLLEGAPADPSQVSLVGSLDPAADVDLFRISLAAAAPPAPGDAGPVDPERAILALAITPQATGQAEEVATPSLLRVEIFLAGSTTNLLRATVTAEGFSVPNLALVGGADVMVRVTSATAKVAAPLPYTLRAEARAASVGEEMEPNGTIAEATEVTAAAATAEGVGYLGWAQDTDWLRVKFPAAGPETTLALDLQLPEGASAQVGFADAQGVVEYGYLRGASRQLTLAHVSPVEGVAWIKIQNTGKAISDARYRLTVSASPAEAGWEREPNQRVEQAQKLGAGIRGHVHPAGDVDTFALCDGAMSVFRIQPPERTALTVRVVDGQARVIAQQDFEAPGTFRAEPPIAPNCHFMQIRGKTGKHSNSLSFYQVAPAP